MYPPAEDVLILEYYTSSFINITQNKMEITKKSKTPVHLPRNLQRSVGHCRRSRSPIVAGHQSQFPRGGGRRGWLTARRISRVHYLSGTHDTSSHPPPATWAKLKFPPRIIFVKINRENNIITWQRRRCVGPRLLDRSPQPLRWHWSIYIAIGERKKLGEIIPLPRRRFRITSAARKQAAEEPRSTGRT
jgi:hypothetical protein